MAHPLYRQIAEDLRHKIESGELGNGSALPAEVELRKQYKASRNAVRDAIKFLNTRGIVVTRPGMGTFVAHKISAYTIQLGIEPGAAAFPDIAAVRRVETTIPRIEIQSASTTVAEELYLQEGEPVVVRHQERHIDSIPWSLQTSFYPMELVQNGATRLLAVEEILPSAVSYLTETLGIRQAGWRERLKVRTLDGWEMEFFRLPGNGSIPVVESNRTIYDENGRPFLLTLTIYPADRNEFVTSAGIVPPPRLAPNALDKTEDRMATEDRIAAAVAVER